MTIPDEVIEYTVVPVKRYKVTTSNPVRFSCDQIPHTEFYVYASTAEGAQETFAAFAKDLPHSEFQVAEAAPIPERCEGLVDRSPAFFRGKSKGEA